MDIKKLDKYLKNKAGVSVRKFGEYTRYLLNDRMFAMLYGSKKYGNVLSLKHKKDDEKDSSQYSEFSIPSEELEPLRWNDFLLDGGIDESVVFNAADESYSLIYSDLSELAKKALDPDEPSYKYVFKNYDLAKVMRSASEEKDE